MPRHYIPPIHVILSHCKQSDNFKEFTFDFLENKFVEKEKDIGKKTTPQSTKEVVCLAQIEKDHAQYSSRGRGDRRGRGRKNFRGRGRGHFKGDFITH